MSFQNQSVQYVLSKHQEAHSICFRSSMVSIEVGWTVAAWVNPAVEAFLGHHCGKIRPTELGGVVPACEEVRCIERLLGRGVYF